MCGPIVLSLSALQRTPCHGDDVGSGDGGMQIVRVVRQSDRIDGDGMTLDAPGPIAAAGQLLMPHLAYSTGRIASYALMGLLAGIMGAGLGRVANLWVSVQSLSLALTALSLLLVGAGLMGWRRAGQVMEMMGRVFWRHLQPVAQRSMQQSAAPSDGGTKKFLRLAGLGSVWGFIPCGMTYGMVLMALASASPLHGMFILIAFGLGTLPNLLLIGGLSQQLSYLLRIEWLRVLTGGLIVIMGLFGLYRLLSGMAFSNGAGIHLFGGWCAQNAFVIV